MALDPEKFRTWLNEILDDCERDPAALAVLRPQLERLAALLPEASATRTRPMAERFVELYQEWVDLDLDPNVRDLSFDGWLSAKGLIGEDLNFLQMWSLRPDPEKYIMDYAVIDFDDGSIAVRRNHDGLAPGEGWMILGNNAAPQKNHAPREHQECISFWHDGDASVGIPGDRADLYVDLSGYDPADAADLRKSLRTEIANTLRSVWDGFPVKSVTDEELAKAGAMEDSITFSEVTWSTPLMDQVEARSRRMLAEPVICEIVHRHGVDVSQVGSGPSCVATSVATTSLKADLDQAGVPYTTFVSDNKAHPDFGKECIEFQFFGEVRPVEGLYYGRIIANEGERSMLTGLGVNLGEYDAMAGAFYAQARPTALARVRDFPGDFKPDLHFRDEATVVGDVPLEDYSVEQLRAEQAYCEWWLHGSQRVYREATKPSKITDMEVWQHSVNQQLNAKLSARSPEAQPQAEGPAPN